MSRASFSSVRWFWCRTCLGHIARDMDEPGADQLPDDLCGECFDERADERAADREDDAACARAEQEGEV